MPRLVLLILLAALAVAHPARAGQSYDNCSGFIDSVPTTITTQGVWCLRADLSTAITSGNAITVNANNVTIDCNEFKLGGLGGGAASTAWGVLSTRLNTTVRNCNIRGFFRGVSLTNGSGYLVESNRFDGNLFYGIYVSGSGSVIRGNLVFDTGGSSGSPGAAYAIEAVGGVDVLDNTVTNVAGNANDAVNFGIFTASNGNGTVERNRVKGIVANPDGYAYGIFNGNSGRILVRDNNLQGLNHPNSVGIGCTSNQGTAGGNFITGFGFAVEACANINNTVNPN